MGSSTTALETNGKMAQGVLPAACRRRWHGLYSRAGEAIKRRKVKVSDANSPTGSGKMGMR
jgi:hypothetical protein